MVTLDGEDVVTHVAEDVQGLTVLLMPLKTLFVMLMVYNIFIFDDDDDD